MAGKQPAKFKDEIGMWECQDCGSSSVYTYDENTNKCDTCGAVSSSKRSKPAETLLPVAACCVSDADDCCDDPGSDDCIDRATRGSTILGELHKLLMNKKVPPAVREALVRELKLDPKAYPI